MGICYPNSCCQCMSCIRCCSYIPNEVKRDSKRNSKWMQELHKFHPQIRLRAMKIPATHDSASYSISKLNLGSSIGITQRLTLYEQLNHGVRFFDIRIGGYKPTLEGIKIMHGPLYGCSVIQCAEEVLKFLNETKEEFVVFRYKEENSDKMTDQMRIDLMKYLEEKFRGLSVTFDDVYGDSMGLELGGWMNPASVTLGDIVSRKKRIFILADPNNFKSYMNVEKEQDRDLEFLQFGRKYNVFNRYQIFNNKWHKQHCSKALLASMKAFCSVNKDKQDRLVMSQFTLSPHLSSFCGVLKIGLGINPIRVDQHVKRLFTEKTLQRYIIENIEELNYCWFDFIDYDMDIVDMLIAANFSRGMTIKKAVHKSFAGQELNITQLVGKKLVKNSLFYAPMALDDLGLPRGKVEIEILDYKGKRYLYEKELRRSSDPMFFDFRKMYFGIGEDGVLKETVRTEDIGISEKSTMMIQPLNVGDKA